jgi:hypothetical protein
MLGLADERLGFVVQCPHRRPRRGRTRPPPPLCRRQRMRVSAPSWAACREGYLPRGPPPVGCTISQRPLSLGVQTHRHARRLRSPHASVPRCVVTVGDINDTSPRCGWAAATLRHAAEPHGRSLLQQGRLRASAAADAGDACRPAHVKPTSRLGIYAARITSPQVPTPSGAMTACCGEPAPTQGEGPPEHSCSTHVLLLVS